MIQTCDVSCTWTVLLHTWLQRYIKISTAKMYPYDSSGTSKLWSHTWLEWSLKTLTANMHCSILMTRLEWNMKHLTANMEYSVLMTRKVHKSPHRIHESSSTLKPWQQICNVVCLWLAWCIRVLVAYMTRVVHNCSRRGHRSITSAGSGGGRGLRPAQTVLEGVSMWKIVLIHKTLWRPTWLHARVIALAHVIYIAACTTIPVMTCRRRPHG